MQVKTKLKAGALTGNHNETLVRNVKRKAVATSNRKASLKVRTSIKAGILPCL